VLGYSRDIHNFAAVEGEDFAQKIVGWGPDLKMYDMDTYNKYKSKYPEIENIPEVGYHYLGTFSVEKVLTLKPNIVILQDGVRESAMEDAKKLEEAGIPTIFIAFRELPNDEYSHMKSTLLLGYLLDKEDRAQDIVDFCSEQVNEVLSRIEEINEPKPTVYVECGTGGPSTYSNTYSSESAFWGVQINRTGAINIADGVINGMKPINPEYVLDANPDVIIITGSYWPATNDSMRLGYYADTNESRSLLKGFTNRPGWDTLNAVKNHRVHSIFHMAPSHLYSFLAYQSLAKYFYPDKFADLNPEENLKEFHERFLPVDYSSVWMLSLEE
jgi:iron complex transport system substrate-binding protein